MIPPGDSNFRVLLGDVELGQQRPELYMVAATQNEQVNITSDEQTVIVIEGVSIHLDWSRWVGEVLTNFSSAENASYSQHRTHINQTGYPTGPAEEIQESSSLDRIRVNLDESSNSFYVEINCTTLGDQNSTNQTSDSAVYELEVCISEGDGGNVECVNASITVYVVMRPPPLGK